MSVSENALWAREKRSFAAMLPPIFANGLAVRLYSPYRALKGTSANKRIKRIASKGLRSFYEQARNATRLIRKAIIRK